MLCIDLGMILFGMIWHDNNSNYMQSFIFPCIKFSWSKIDEHLVVLTYLVSILYKIPSRRDAPRLPGQKVNVIGQGQRSKVKHFLHDLKDLCTKM